jgi:hypothetical protein
MDLTGQLSILRTDRQLEIERLFEQPLIDTLGEEAFAREQAIGAEMSLDVAQSLADPLIKEALVES